MGLLTSLFRLFHPLHYAKRRIKRAIIPRPIRRATWIVGGVAHPVSRVKYSARRGVIRAVDKAITPRPKPRGGANRVRKATSSHRKPASTLKNWDQVARFVARETHIPVERVREFTTLVREGREAEATRLVTNEEASRMTAAYKEATRRVLEAKD